MNINKSSITELTNHFLNDNTITIPQKDQSPSNFFNSKVMKEFYGDETLKAFKDRHIVNWTGDLLALAVMGTGLAITVAVGVILIVSLIPELPIFTALFTGAKLSLDIMQVLPFALAFETLKIGAVGILSVSVGAISTAILGGVGYVTHRLIWALVNFITDKDPKAAYQLVEKRSNELAQEIQKELSNTIEDEKNKKIQQGQHALLSFQEHLKSLNIFSHQEILGILKPLTDVLYTGQRRKEYELYSKIKNIVHQNPETHDL